MLVLGRELKEYSVYTVKYICIEHVLHAFYCATCTCMCMYVARVFRVVRLRSNGMCHEEQHCQPVEAALCLGGEPLGD